MSSVVEDLDLCAKLLESGHLSPFDHAAVADTKDERGLWVDAEYHKRFYGWKPLRANLEKDKPSRRCAVLENRSLRNQM